MELGVSAVVYQWAGIPLYRALDYIADFGFNHIDIPSQLDWQPANMPVKNQLRIAKKMEQLDIKGSGVIIKPDFSLGSRDKDEQDFNLKQLIRAGNFIKRMGGKQVIVCKAMGHRHFEISDDEVKQNAVNLLNRFGEWCETNDVAMVFEFAPRYLDYLNKAEDMRWLLDQITTTEAYANIDIGHLVLTRDRPEKLDVLKGRISHVHLSDNDGISTEADVLLGEGIVDHKAYLDKVFELGIEETCKKARMDCCAVIEVASDPVIEHPDFMVMKSLSHILTAYPYFRGADNQ